MANKLNRILILNRGEIACRLIQAVQELGKTAIAIYSNTDAGARHTTLANESYCIGGETPADSYLQLDKIVKLAKEQKCDAVHPGYGFLSERAEAANAFTKAGVVWIGPSGDCIDKLGNKVAAKELLTKSKVPTTAWAKVDPKNPKDLQAQAKKIGFPLLLKAAAGGVARACV